MISRAKSTAGLPNSEISMNETSSVQTILASMSADCVIKAEQPALSMAMMKPADEIDDGRCAGVAKHLGSHV
jgi:hypothetical protein